MSKRHVTFWICLIIGWLAVLPFSALAAEFQQRAALSEEAAERYLVVVNAGNRASGTPEEIRQLIRAIYLKQIGAWPSDQPGTPLARPPGSAAAKAFALDILDLDEAGLEAYWSSAGRAPPEVIENSRDLLRRISRDEGALAVITKAEAQKLPAKVRVLFEFTPPAPGLPETERVERFIAENEEHFKRRLQNFVRSHFSDQDVGWALGAKVSLVQSFKAEESRAEGVVLRVKFSGEGHPQIFALDERLLVRLEDGDIEILERLRKPTTAFDDDEDEAAKVERFIAADVDRFQRRVQRFVRKSFTSQDVSYPLQSTITGMHSYEVLESDGETARIRIAFSIDAGSDSGTFDEIFLARFADDDIEIIERLGPARAGVSDDQDGRTQTAESAVASPTDIRAYLASHDDEAAEALDNYIVASDQPYGNRLRELISHKVLEERPVGALVEFRYVGWDSPYAKQRVIARLEGGALALYDPAAATRLAALPSVASDAIEPAVQADDAGSVEEAAPTTGGAVAVTAPTSGTPLDTGAQETDDSVITEFDGLWESKGGQWHGTLEIKDGRYRTDLVCQAVSIARVSGRVLPGGRLEDSYFRSGIAGRGFMTGSIEELQVYGGSNNCQRGTLSFHRVIRIPSKSFGGPPRELGVCLDALRLM